MRAPGAHAAVLRHVEIASGLPFPERGSFRGWKLVVFLAPFILLIGYLGYGLATVRIDSPWMAVRHILPGGRLN